MKSGVCPKCHHATVFAKELGFQVGENYHGVMIRTSMIVRPSTYVTYLCSSCGYSEFYVTDQAKLAEVMQAWPRVEPKAPGFDV
jgi:predicted nucleic-acid-binding Zn-ribbon protein